MELRHLRYFVAVAEAGSLQVAAHQRLHTTQPSLSRQIRDMEEEIGAKLLTRTSRGIILTAAGRVFLDHARVVLSQVEVGIESARRLADPVKPYFVLGFMTGHESTWLPEALELLRDELARRSCCHFKSSLSSTCRSPFQGTYRRGFSSTRTGGIRLRASPADKRTSRGVHEKPPIGSRL